MREVVVVKKQECQQSRDSAKCIVSCGKDGVVAGLVQNIQKVADSKWVVFFEKQTTMTTLSLALSLTTVFTATFALSLAFALSLSWGRDWVLENEANIDMETTDSFQGAEENKEIGVTTNTFCNSFLVRCYYPLSLSFSLSLSLAASGVLRRKELRDREGERSGYLWSPWLKSDRLPLDSLVASGLLGRK
jgi:hypothetical protein